MGRLTRAEEARLHSMTPEERRARDKQKRRKNGWTDEGRNIALSRTLRKKYKSAQALTKAVNAYFDECDANGTLYTEHGLCNHLGVDVRSTRCYTEPMKDATEEQQAYERIVQGAYARIIEQILTDPRYEKQVAYKIFCLKQPWFGGYSDQVKQQELNIHLKIGDGMEMSDFL